MYLANDHLTQLRLNTETPFQKFLSGSAWLLTLGLCVLIYIRSGLLYYDAAQPSLTSTDSNYITSQLERGKNLRIKWFHKNMFVQCPNQKSSLTYFHVTDLFLAFGSLALIKFHFGNWLQSLCILYSCLNHGVRYYENIDLLNMYLVHI